MNFKILLLIILPIFLFSSEEKTIYLTFDDGPTFGTKNVLSILQEEKIPATMFIIGKNTVKNSQTYEEILASDYVSIANHTYSHANGRYRQFYSNEEKVFQDIKKNNELLVKSSKPLVHEKLLPLRLAGRNVFRLPNLNANDYSLPKEQRVNEYKKYDKLQEEGFHIFGWDIEWEFTQEGKVSQTPNELVSQIEYLHKRKKSKLPNKIILLMHDFTFINKHNGKEDLRNFIKLLKAKGWKFETINNYL